MTDSIATGTFAVDLTPEPSGSGVATMTLAKRWEGGMSGTSEGRMLSYGSPASGAAGYVAMERFEGALDGRRGSFALQHSGTLDAGGQSLSITIVPGSGTDQLAGIAGALELSIADGTHRYTLRYRLPDR